MYKALITNNVSGKTFGGLFPTLEQAEAWVDSQSAQGVFGKLDRWIREQDLSSQGEDIARSTASESRNEGTNTYQYFYFPQEFTYRIFDITEQKQAETFVIKSMDKQNFGSRLIAEIERVNSTKQWAPDQWTALFSNPTLSAIERCLWNGSLVTAKTLIQSLDNTFYTNDEKLSIIGMIDNYLARM